MTSESIKKAIDSWGVGAVHDGSEESLQGGGGGPYDPSMEQRVRTLESDMKDIKASLARIESDLAHKPSYGGMLGMMVALVGLVVAAAFGGASFGG